MIFRRKQAEKQKVKHKTSYQADRRISSDDRREFGPPSTFPLVDSNGKVVKQDRRTRPDRRVNNITVKENHININKSI